MQTSKPHKMKQLKTDIEREYNFTYKNHSFTIQRDTRQDCFLSWIQDHRQTHKAVIIPDRTIFLTLKGATEHAKNLIEINIKHLPE